jgi:hypothetical protein
MAMTPSRSIAVLLAALLMTACADLTPMQRKTLTVGAAILVTGAIAVREAENGSQTPRVTTPGNPCTVSRDSCY